MSEQMMNEQIIMEQITSENTEVKSVGFTKTKSGKKQIEIISAIGVIIIAVAVGLGLYNTPSSCLTRQLELGQKYLTEQKYEQAILAFEKAIEIDDRSMQAYVGEIEAYLHLDDKEGIVALYDRARVVIKEFDEESRAFNKDNAIRIYLYANEVYDESNKVVSVLEESLLIYKDSVEIIDALVDEYIEIAAICIEEGNYVEALKYYEKCLELDSENTKVRNELDKLLKEYIDLLMQEERYDEVRLLCDEYKLVDAFADFEEVLYEIDELEEKALILTDEELAIIANAYAMRMEYMWDNKFEVLDITNDGIPEIIGAAGCTIITYTPWNQCAEIIWNEMVLYDLYYDAELNKVLAYTSNWDKTNEMLMEMTITVVEGENPFSWTKGEWIENFDGLANAKLIVDGAGCCTSSTDRSFANSIARYNNDAETRGNLLQILKENMSN